MARFLGWVRVLRQKQGQDLAEYALLLPVVFVILLVFDTLARAIGLSFDAVRNALEAALRSGQP